MIVEIGLIQNFLLSLIIVAGIAAILFIALSIFQKRHNIHSDSMATPTDEQNIEKGYRSVIKDANKHARILLRETAATAAEMLTGAKRTNEKIEENVDHVLQNIAARDIHSMKEVTEKYGKDYEIELEKLNKELSTATQLILQNTQKAYNDKLESFTNDLLKNGLQTQDVIDKKTAELLSVVESEIAEYKKAQIEKVEEQVKKLLEKVYREVLRVSIPQNVHEELILKSLEDAKKDGLFRL